GLAGKDNCGRQRGCAPACTGSRKQRSRALSIAIAEDYAAQHGVARHAAFAKVVETEEGGQIRSMLRSRTGMTPRLLRKLAIATVVLVVGLYFIPIITIVWLAAGLIDVLRNRRRDAVLFERYF